MPDDTDNPKALVVELADAIAAFLREQGIAAERRLVLERQLAQSRTLKAVVMPHGLTSEITARSPRKERVVKIDVGVMKQATETEIEGLLLTMQQIADLVEGRRFGVGLCTGIEFSPIFDSGAWLELHSFLAVLTLSVKVMQ